MTRRASIFPSIPRDALILFAASFAMGLVGLALLSGGLSIVLRESRLARDGVIVEGTVQQLERIRISSTSHGGGGLFSSGGDGAQSGVVVHYSFRANNNRYDGEGSAVFPQDGGLAVGGPVTVRYLPSQPDVSELHASAGSGYVFALMGAVALLFAIGIFAFGLSQRD